MKVTWQPGEGEAGQTIAYGRVFHANIPLEIGDDEGYPIEESEQGTAADGRRVLVTKARRVTILEMARGNPTMHVEGDTPPDPRGRGRPKNPTTPEEYRAWAQDWFRRIETSEGLADRWDNEERLRLRCQCGELDVEFLQPFFDARMKALQSAEATE